MNSGLNIWTVYDHPKDYPEYFVARLFINDKPTNQVLFHHTLDALRELLPPDLYCMPRAPEDDPVIVECWF